MKKSRISSLLMVGILAVVTLVTTTACKNEIERTEYVPLPVAMYDITFDSRGGTSVPTQVIMEGKCAVEPKDPTYINNPDEPKKFFGKWYTDPACTEGNEYNFANQVKGNITLYGSWIEEKEKFLLYDSKYIVVSQGSGQSGSALAAPDYVKGDDNKLKLKMNGVCYYAYYPDGNEDSEYLVTKIFINRDGVFTDSGRFGYFIPYNGQIYGGQNFETYEQAKNAAEDCLAAEKEHPTDCRYTGSISGRTGIYKTVEMTRAKLVMTEYRRPEPNPQFANVIFTTLSEAPECERP